MGPNDSISVDAVPAEGRGRGVFSVGSCFVPPRAAELLGRRTPCKDETE